MGLLGVEDLGNCGGISAMGQEKGTVLHILSGDLWGGAEAQMLHQLRAVRAMGWDVQILLLNRLEAAELYEKAEFPCSIVEESRGLFRLLQQGRATVDCLNPQLLVAHGYKQCVLAWWIARKRDIPWLAMFHGRTEADRGVARLRMAAYQLLQQILVRYSAEKVIVVSQNLAQELKLDKLNHLEIIRNVYSPPATEEKKTIRKKTLSPRPAIAVVGRLVRVKRVDRAINAFCQMCEQSGNKQVQSSHMYIIGDGPERAALERQAADSSHSEQIHFLGFRQEADKLIAEANLLLITSDSEGIPTVLLEAIGNGVPVLSTNVGGIPEVFTQLSEYPHELTDTSTEELSSALERMIKKRGLRKKAQACYQKFVDLFSPEVAAQRHNQLYLQLITQHQTAAMTETSE